MPKNAKQKKNPAKNAVKTENMTLLELRNAGFNIHVVDAATIAGRMSAVQDALYAAQERGLDVGEIQTSFMLLLAYLNWNELLPHVERRFVHCSLDEVRSRIAMLEAGMKLSRELSGASGA